jgi:hypothetical protein
MKKLIFRRNLLKSSLLIFGLKIRNDTLAGQWDRGSKLSFIALSIKLKRPIGCSE